MNEYYQRRPDGKVVILYDFTDEQDEGDALPEIPSRQNVVPFKKEDKR
jgi:hypothetical protein